MPSLKRLIIFLIDSNLKYSRILSSFLSISILFKNILNLIKKKTFDNT